MLNESHSSKPSQTSPTFPIGYNPDIMDKSQAPTSPQSFSLGTPAIVCRWRLSNAALPLENRHLRALSRRYIDSTHVSQQLVAWAKQHIEWTLADGAHAHPSGVLMLVIDRAGHAAMTAGDYTPLSNTRTSALCARAFLAEKEAQETGVAPEALWAVVHDKLMWCEREDRSISGANSLIFDLAKTLGIIPTKREDLISVIRNEEETFDEVFLVSDEHGVVCADGYTPAFAKRFAHYYHTLLEKTASRT